MKTCDFAPSGTFDPVTLLPITHPTQPSRKEIVSVARQMRGFIDMEKDLSSRGEIADVEFLKNEEQSSNN